MELDQSKVHKINEIADYVPNTVVSRTILKKTTGNIMITSVPSGEEILKKISPFDIYLQIIDGTAEVTIGEEIFIMKSSEGIIIPSHSPHSMTARQSFKMIATVIKSGYEL
jgi:quercetin dioxygenase-like cupin family protein